MAQSRGRKPGSQELSAKAAAVKLLVFDVDGVLTDGGLYYGPEGEALKRFDVKDGHALVMARLLGLKAAVLTARTSQIVEVRGRELGMVAVEQGHKDKERGLLQLCERVGVTPFEVGYMGDDINDLAPMGMVGLPACPSDAVPEVRQCALFIAQSPGGRGAARELVELCLKATNLWSRGLEMMTKMGSDRPGSTAT
ncbi:MAG TPA: HAD hydrolase family protein [Myxococcaceae bacterium]|nr:HAD hydrolase family protein [Myxococcaceae bacterium]